MDEVVAAIEEAKQQWNETWVQIQEHVKSIEEFGKSRNASEEKNSLPRLNGLAQDGLAMLDSLQFKLDVLAPQLPTYDDVESAQTLLESWKQQSRRACHQFWDLICDMIISSNRC
ncbi:hypothetical protein Ancab_023070 [Ancistrocladus abbreviatus]